MPYLDTSFRKTRTATKSRNWAVLHLPKDVLNPASGQEGIRQQLYYSLVRGWGWGFNALHGNLHSRIFSVFSTE